MFWKKTVASSVFFLILSLQPIVVPFFCGTIKVKKTIPVSHKLWFNAAPGGNARNDLLTTFCFHSLYWKRIDSYDTSGFLEDKIIEVCQSLAISMRSLSISLKKAPLRTFTNGSWLIVQSQSYTVFYCFVSDCFQSRRIFQSCHYNGLIKVTDSELSSLT